MIRIMACQYELILHSTFIYIKQVKFTYCSLQLHLSKDQVKMLHTVLLKANLLDQVFISVPYLSLNNKMKLKNGYLIQHSS